MTTHILPDRGARPWLYRIAGQSLLLLVLPCSSPSLFALSYSPRPHLVFVEGSLGGGWNSAFNREADIVNGAGPFFWSYDGSYYRYRSSDLLLTAGFGYEFLMLDWVGIRASYSYHSYLSNWTARTGTGRYSRSSVIGGQVAETDGYFVGPVFRYNPFDWPIHFEVPVLWGMHSGSYKPLQGYTEFRDSNATLPQLTDEYREQPLELSKWRFGLGFAFLQEGFPLYLSMQFLYESAVTLTTVGPGDVLPAGSAWQSFIVVLAGGWRF